ncbi:MAG: hypothetical protein E7J43_07250, partial [Finegoldia magna]|nr:hypothetical protein [Finegoldia magna]
MGIIISIIHKQNTLLILIRRKSISSTNKKNGLEDLRNGSIKTDLVSMISDITNNKVNTVGTIKVMVNKDTDI